MAGKLYLIPTPLGSGPEKVLPAFNTALIAGLRFFIVEEIRTARRFLRSVIPDFPIDESVFHVLDEHTRPGDLVEILAPLIAGNSMGLMSEAGCPATADPGGSAVAMAHSKGIQVVPLTGPSSIILGLMASGLNGQNFAFCGYLPQKKEELPGIIRKFEQRCQRENQTHVFIETPYRNESLFKTLLSHLQPETRLCVAIDLSLDNEQIIQHSVKEWKNLPLPALHKRPAIFLIGKEALAG